MSNVHTLRIGHRCAAGYEPENTLAALKRAIALNIDFVEVDVQQTLDGEFVLMHDKFVDRTTNGHGRLTEMRLQDLRALDAGKGECIPTVQNFLNTANGRVSVILEIITPGIGLQLYRQVKQCNFKNHVIFSSFLHADIRAIRELDSTAMTMALLEGIPIDETAFARDALATHAGIALDSMTFEFAESLFKAGLEVFIYTADTPEQIALAKSLQANGVISNFPDRI